MFNEMKEYVVDFFKNYVNFKGKVARRKFWLTILAMAICLTVVYLVVGILFGILAAATKVAAFSTIGTVLCTLVELAIIIPELALVERRLLDVGAHWKYIFWLLCPIVGLILVIIKCVQPSAEATPVVEATEAKEE